MIPKVIHYIWLGNNKPVEVEKAILTWKKYAPEYRINEWNESNLPEFKNKFYQEAIKNKNYAFASDYARLWVLYNYGGIYMDTDMYLLASPNKIIDDKQLVFGIQNTNIIFSAGFIASIPKQKFIKEALNLYSKLNFNEVKEIPNTSLLSPLVYKLYGFNKSIKTQYRVNRTVVAYSPNVLLQPSFHAVAMHVGEKSWSNHNIHDRIRIVMRRHIKTRVIAGSFRIFSDFFRRFI